MQRAQNLIFAGTNMTVRRAINGFGRIGANVLRAIVEYGRKDVTVAAIIGVGGAATAVSLLKCVSGSFRGMITDRGSAECATQPSRSPSCSRP